MYRYFVSYVIGGLELKYGNCEVSIPHLIRNYEDIQYVTKKIKNMLDLEEEETPIIMFYKEMRDE